MFAGHSLLGGCLWVLMYVCRSFLSWRMCLGVDVCLQVIPPLEDVFRCRYRFAGHSHLGGCIWVLMYVYRSFPFWKMCIGVDGATDYRHLLQLLGYLRWVSSALPPHKGIGPFFGGLLAGGNSREQGMPSRPDLAIKMQRGPRSCLLLSREDLLGLAVALEPRDWYGLHPPADHAFCPLHPRDSEEPVRISGVLAACLSNV
jgi:hypothetical protein